MRRRRRTMPPRVEQLESRELLSTATAGTPAPSLSGSLPDTSNGIFAFSDQLPGGLSDRMVQFLATHFAGAQKMLSSDTARLRAVNPNWFDLHYQLATASGPVSYI